MTATAPSRPSPAEGSLAVRISAAALAGGAVDFAYATAVALSAGRPPTGPWRRVASGWIGAAAGDGVGPVALGVLTHFGVAACMAAVYVLAARRVPVLVRRPLASGLLYGLALYGVMYRVVLPLRWPEVFPRWDGGRSLLDIAAHVGVGLAIAWVTAGFEKRYAARRQAV